MNKDVLFLEVIVFILMGFIGYEAFGLGRQVIENLLGCQLLQLC